MKKVYVFLAFLWLSIVAAQAQISRPVPKGRTHVPGLSIPANHNRSAGPTGGHQINSVLWTDDFSNPANWTMTHSAGPGDWVIGTNPPSGANPIDPINSTSAANGFALYDSDALCDTSQIADLTTTNPINLSGHPNLRLMFSQFYRRFIDSSFVFVSNDGTNWIKYSVNKNLAPFQYNDGHISHNPAHVTLDISSVAGNQDSVWIKFQFYSPGLLAANAGCSYAWMIDDVSILDIDSIDARPSQAFAGEYTEIPIIQAEAFKMQGKVINNGLAPMTGAALDFFLFDSQLNNIYYDSSTVSGNIDPGDTSGFLNVVNPPYAITIPDVYFVQNLSKIAGDTTTGNDLEVAIVNVNDSSYSRDYTAIDGDIATSYGFQTNGGYFGQVYHIYQASSVTSATFLLTNPIFGANIRVGVYTMNGTVPGSLIAWSATHTINATDTLNFDYMTIPFQAPIGVTPGDYMLVINQMDTNFISLAVSKDIVTPGKNFYRATSPAWSILNIGYSLILRLNNPSSTLVGVKELEKSSSIEVYPNPTKGLINIVAADEKNAQISVLNSLGQVVKTEFHETLHNSQINLTGLPSGIYTINVMTSKSEMNKTVVLE